MAKEVERKFLVIDYSYKPLSTENYEIVQGYLSRDPKATVRVRTKGTKGFITVKGKNSGCVRDEWEYEIPLSEAIEMLRLCEAPVLNKTRYIV
ncbi:MAG: adenylate cyclase, partial [Muribaculaceae bacterium]|nr:adenylate cyclase [Muribaculaceae bacterium]